MSKNDSVPGHRALLRPAIKRAETFRGANHRDASFDARCPARYRLLPGQRAEADCRRPNNANREDLPHGPVVKRMCD